MKRSTALYLNNILLALVLVGAVGLVLTGCGHVGQNIERDGYQVGDISEGLKEDKAWYCGEGMLGIRAIARAVIALVTGTAIPNVCRVLDVVTEQEDGATTE